MTTAYLADPVTTAVLAGRPAGPHALLGTEPVALVDLLDRVLAAGVVVTGEITLSIADVDLVHISLRALISSMRPDLFGEKGEGECDRELAAGPPAQTLAEAQTLADILL